MKKIITVAVISLLILSFGMFSFLSKNNSEEFDTRIKVASSIMNMKNMYHRIMWDKQPTTEYNFDQTLGEVTYFVDDKQFKVIAKPYILGTFNLDDKTFLWADKNSSINKSLSSRIPAFRETLPKKYRKDKFESTPDFNSKLLTLFSSEMKASGYDNQLQDRTIIYYTLQEVQVYQNDNLILDIPTSFDLQVEQNTELLTLIKKYHSDKVEVNKLHHEKKLETMKAFDEIKKVHLQYWLNEDPYFNPSLSWPCDFDQNSIIEWSIFTTPENRVFVMYLTDLGWSTETYAYEIDTTAKGEKVIIGKY